MAVAAAELPAPTMALAVSDDVAKDMPMITLIVKNHGVDPPARLTTTLSSGETFAQMHSAVADAAQFVAGTFEIRVFDRTYCLDDPEAHERRLYEDNYFAAGSKLKVDLHGMDGLAPLSTAAPADGATSGSGALDALSTVAAWSQQQGETPTRGMSWLRSTGQHWSSKPVAAPPAPPNAEGFVGLKNQGATCYLSSLLQSLYMTPEFRQAIYGWRWTGGDLDGDDAKASIALQLQMLFVALQCGGGQGGVRAVDTKALTHSFGWGAADAFTQHDAQELLRVLFDALEREFEGTPQASVLALYRGETQDYVQCKACGAESTRPSPFDDLSLAIRPFGPGLTPYGSVEEALAAYLEPETLDGDNQYLCERCGCKRDALKGIKLSGLPHVLCVGLKRFDFDLQTLRRVKLYHKVAVPSELDLRRYTEGGTVARQHSQKRRLMGGGTPGGTPLAGPSAPPMLPPLAPLEALPAESDGGAVPMETDEAAPTEAVEAGGAATMETTEDGGGPSVGGGDGDMHYELFSVLMHSGGALAGHYYAFIRDFSRGAWFKFNASHVSAVGDAELAAAAGSEDGRASGYMLMYRRVRADNPRGVGDDAVPADVKAHVLAQLAKAKAAGPSAGAVCAPCGPVYGPVCRKPAVTRPNAAAKTCVISADDGIRVTGDSPVVDDDGDDGER